MVCLTQYCLVFSLSVLCAFVWSRLRFSSLVTGCLKSCCFGLSMYSPVQVFYLAKLVYILLCLCRSICLSAWLLIIRATIVVCLIQYNLSCSLSICMISSYVSFFYVGMSGVLFFGLCIYLFIHVLCLAKLVYMLMCLLRSIFLSALLCFLWLEKTTNHGDNAVG